MTTISYPAKPWERCTKQQLLTGVLAAIDTRDRALRHNGELQAAVDRVRRLHGQDTSLLAPGKWCPGCGEEEPCRTIRVLNGATA